MDLKNEILEILSKEIEELKNISLTDDEVIELDRANLILDTILLRHKPICRNKPICSKQNLQFIGFTREITIKPTIFTSGEEYNNGYIAIPPGHPLNGLSYEEFSLGDEEWTYSEEADKDFLEDATPVVGDLNDITEDYWIIGYDTAHSWDNAETKSQKYVAEKVRKYIELLENNEYVGGNE